MIEENQDLENTIKEDLIEIKADNSLSDFLICPLCCGLLRKPILSCTKCNYYGCGVCIDRWLKEKPNQCPVKCASSVKFERRPQKILEHILGIIQVRCVFSENPQDFESCCQVLSYEKIFNHVSNCDYKVVQCDSPGCSEFCLRRQLMDHKNNCQFRTEKCNFCVKNVKFIDLNEHVQTCTYRTFICPECNIPVQENFRQLHPQKCLRSTKKCSNCNEMSIQNPQNSTFCRSCTSTTVGDQLSNGETDLIKRWHQINLGLDQKCDLIYSQYKNIALENLKIYVLNFKNSSSAEILGLLTDSKPVL